MTRVAALDCGTNSLRLLIADVGPDSLVDVVRRMEVVRLGEGVDRTGRLSAAALARTWRALDDYAAVIAEHSVDLSRVRLVATSATRDAANRDEFTAGVLDRLGVAPDVVTGDAEARLSFEGATRELRGTARLSSPYLAVDIGGGSTELVLGDDEGAWAAHSMDVGCVRLTERHFASDPPTAQQVAAARSDVEAALDEAERTVRVRDARTMVGLAGSVTTVTALALDLEEYDAARIHHARTTAGQVVETTERLLCMSRDERARLPAMHPGRVDVIAAGALVLQVVLARAGLDSVVASEHDILDGIALSVAGSLA